MQMQDIINQILQLFQDPLILILTLWIIGIIIGVAVFRRPKGPKDPSKPKRPKIKVKGHLMKPMQKMLSDAEKNKNLSVPQVRSRQEIVTQMFESKMDAIDLEASESSGYVPVSYTPLARYLKDHDVEEKTVSAIIDGIMEEESEEDVTAIIQATADSLDLVDEELNKVIELAIEEWRNVKKTSAS